MDPVDVEAVSKHFVGFCFLTLLLPPERTYDGVPFTLFSVIPNKPRPLPSKTTQITPSTRIFLSLLFHAGTFHNFSLSLAIGYFPNRFIRQPHPRGGGTLCCFSLSQFFMR